MSIIREPYVNIDLTVQYRDLDIEPLPNTPIVGGVVRSDYYADYYYSLTEKQRNKERRAIEIKTKRQFFEKITRGNLVKPDDHISLKNAYYLSGAVHAFFAPEIPFAEHKTNRIDTNTTNIRDRITLTSFLAYRIPPQPPPISTVFLSAIYENEDTFSVFYTIPLIRFENIPPLAVNNNVLTALNQPIYYLKVGNREENIIASYECDIEDPIKSFTSTNTQGPVRIILTQNYLLYIRKDVSGSNTNYIGFLFKKADKLDSDFIQQYHSELLSSAIAFCTDTANTPLGHQFIPTPIHPAINSTISDPTLYSSFRTFIDQLNDDEMYYLSNYILADVDTSGTPHVPYNTTFYGKEMNYSGQFYSVIFYYFYYSHSNSAPHQVSWQAYSIGNTNAISDFTRTLLTSGYQAHNLNIINIPNGFAASTPITDNIELITFAAILKINERILWTREYTYDQQTFIEALELLDMVDLLIDNGYCTTKNDFNVYSGPIAIQAINMDGEKVPALAVINTPIGIAPADVNIANIPVTTYVNTFVTANYFKYDGLGYPTLLPASSLYAVKVVSMYATLNGFNPIYNKPIIPISPVDKVYSEEERQMLLNKAVNSLKSYQNSWVFNNNVTLAALQNNIFKEENIRRLANKVARELKLILKTYLGRKNTRATRTSVVNAIKRMYSVHIEPHEYKPDDFVIICDETNNTDYDRYLYVTIIVKMPLSIKYVELVTVAIDLEQS